MSNAPTNLSRMERNCLIGMEIDKKSALYPSVNQRGYIGKVVNSARRSWLWPILFKIQVKMIETVWFLVWPNSYTHAHIS